MKKQYFLPLASFQRSDFLIDSKTTKLAVIVNEELHEVKSIGINYIKTKSHGPAEDLVDCFEPLVSYQERNHPTSQVHSA